MNKSTARFDSSVARYSLLAYQYGMSRALRSVRLALEPLATIYRYVK
jgi:hypothetical protein